MDAFKPLNLAEIYRSADAGVAQAMQMNLMAMQTQRTRQEFETEDALRGLAKRSTVTDPNTGETSFDLRSFAQGAYSIDPMKGLAFSTKVAEADKSALERAKLQGDIDEQRYKRGQERLKLLGDASTAPYLEWKRLTEGGMSDQEARAKVQPMFDSARKNLIASGIFTKQQLDAIGSYVGAEQFDPASAQTAMNQVLGADKALADFRASRQPQSAIGKLKLDLDEKRITPEQYAAAVQKETSDNSRYEVDKDRGVIIDKVTKTTYPLTGLPAKGDDVGGLRREFNNREEVKNYNAAVPVWRSITNAPDTGAGDLDLIYGAGKILDPGSVVREGEMALTIKTGSPLQRILGTTQFSIDKGGRLTADTRQKLVEAMHNRVSELHRAATDARKPFEAQAKRQNISLEETLTLPELPAVDSGRIKPKGAAKIFDGLPNAAQFRGRTMKGEDGSEWTSNGTEWIKK